MQVTNIDDTPEPIQDIDLSGALRHYSIAALNARPAATRTVWGGFNSTSQRSIPGRTS